MVVESVRFDIFFFFDFLSRGEANSMRLMLVLYSTPLTIGVACVEACVSGNFIKVRETLDVFRAKPDRRFVVVGVGLSNCEDDYSS